MAIEIDLVNVALTYVHSASFVVHNLFLVPVTFFSFIFYITAFRTIFAKDKSEESDKNENIDWPKVTIQIPTFNEVVAIRCARSCLNFDYPADRFQIIIGDDSDDIMVSAAIYDFANENPGRVKVTRRGNNSGFKPGNLNYMLQHSDGEIIVIFDSDFTANPDFLKRIVMPFTEDENIACVQSEWEFVNESTNYVSKLATTLLLFYYALIVPINKKVGVPLIFGSGEAIRKDVIKKLGNWREGSLTEDTEFSIRVLRSGYRIVHLKDLKVYGEVPHTMKGLISQQKRWAYGNTTAFILHARSILFGPFSSLQKIMLSFTTYIGYISNFVILLFLVSGVIFFFSQPRDKPIDLYAFVDTTSRIMLLTSGFGFAGFVSLYKRGKKNILIHSMLSLMSVGVLVSANVCVGFYKAMRGKKMVWSAIPKEGNINF